MLGDGELITLDPDEEPLVLTGTSVDHGIYLLAHEYPEPEKVDLRSGSALSTGRKGALNGYGNRVIPATLRVAEPPTNATVDVDAPGADPTSGVRPATGGPLFHAILQQLEQKCERMTRRGGDEGVGGVYERTLPGGETIRFDVVRASCVVTTDRQFAHGRAQVELSFECLPLGYAADWTDHGDTSAELAPIWDSPDFVLVFESLIDGTADALGELTVEDAAVAPGDQKFFLRTAAQLRRRDPSANADLFYYAPDMTPLGTHTVATNVEAEKLGPTYRAVLSTDLSFDESKLTHRGRFRVVARVKVVQTVAAKVDLAFEYGKGDMRQFSRLGDVALRPSDKVGSEGAWANTWRCVDLGIVELDTDEWEGRLLCRETGGSLASPTELHIHSLEFWPVDEFYAELSGAPQIPSPAVFHVRDGFAQTAGNLNGKLDELALSAWATAGDAGDFLVSGGGVSTGILTRANGSELTGRRASIGTVMSDMVVQVDFKRSANPGNLWQMLIARFVDAANHFVIGFSATNAGEQYIEAWKVIGGVSTQIGGIGIPALGIDTWYSQQVVVDHTGRFFYWLWPRGSFPGDPLVTGYDAAFKTGGTLDDGKGGLQDWKGSSFTGVRSYDNFFTATPDLDAAIFPQQAARLTYDRAERLNEDGDLWVPMSVHEGDLFTIPPSGRERQPVRFMVRGQGQHPSWGPDDDNAEALRAGLRTIPRWLAVPGPL